MDIIKQRLIEEIKNSGLSTVEISKRVGVSAEMITQYCTTNKLRGFSIFYKLGKELNASKNYFLCRKNKKNAPRGLLPRGASFYLNLI